MKYFNLILFIGVILMAQSCSPSVVKIGTLNMISHRNVDPSIEYEMVSSYSGSSEKELKKSEAENVEEALEQTVKKVPGGEFLMNVKLYQIKGKYYAVEGDIWGKKGKKTFRGFAVGDKVVCKDKKFLKKLDFSNDVIYGTITGLIDDKEVYVKLNDVDRTIKIPYEKITKSM